MKTLMKKIGGCKKARYWNMARFQTRRWHREHAQPAEATNNGSSAPTQPVSAANAPFVAVKPRTADSAIASIAHPSAPSAIPSPGGEGQGEGGLSASSSRPLIQESNHPPIQPPVPPLIHTSINPSIQPLAAPPSSVSSSEGTQPILDHVTSFAGFAPHKQPTNHRSSSLRAESAVASSGVKTSVHSENPKWDKNQNFKLSQPSPSATSTDKVGTPVPSGPSSEGTQPIHAGRSSESTNPNSTVDKDQKTKPAGIGCGVVEDSPPASRPLRPSVNEDPKNAFVNLRANGWSLRSISQKLGVPKSTLFNWESDTATRRAIEVIKSVHIERLQEQYLPSFEEELQKLSTCLSRIERALEKHDFDKMKPEFLLRTSLQLRSQLNKLRIDAHPTDTLDHGPRSKSIRGCISRAERLTDSSDDSSSSSCSSSSSNSPSPKLPPPEQSDPAALPAAVAAAKAEASTTKDPSNSQNAKWDKNQNPDLSQPSAPTTSSEKSGTRVPTPPVVPASTPPTPGPNQSEHIVLTAGFHSNRPPAGTFAKAGLRAEALAKAGLPDRTLNSRPSVQASTSLA